MDVFGVLLLQLFPSLVLFVYLRTFCLASFFIGHYELAILMDPINNLINLTKKLIIHFLRLKCVFFMCGLDN